MQHPPTVAIYENVIQQSCARIECATRLVRSYHSGGCEPGLAFLEW